MCKNISQRYFYWPSVQMYTPRTPGVNGTSWTSFKCLTYVKFRFCIQGARTSYSRYQAKYGKCFTSSQQICRYGSMPYTFSWLYLAKQKISKLFLLYMCAWNLQKNCMKIHASVSTYISIFLAIQFINATGMSEWEWVNENEWNMNHCTKNEVFH